MTTVENILAPDTVSRPSEPLRRLADFRERLCVAGSAAACLFLLSVGANAQTAAGGATLNGLNPALLSSGGTFGTAGAPLAGPALDISGEGESGGPGGENLGGGLPLGGGEDDGRSARSAARDAGRALAQPVPQPFEQALQRPVPRVSSLQGAAGRAPPPFEPFEPLGVRAGKFVLRPAVSFDTGYSSNSTNDVTGSGSAFVRIGPELAVESDFARHALALQLQAGVARFASGADARDLNASAIATGRFDVDDDTFVTGTASFIAEEDDLTGVADDPLETTSALSLQLDHGLRQLDLRSALRVERNVNGDFVDAAGVLQKQDDLNSTVVGGNLRGTLRRSGSLSPFVEADLSR